MASLQRQLSSLQRQLSSLQRQLSSLQRQLLPGVKQSWQNIKLKDYMKGIFSRPTVPEHYFE